MGISAVLYPAPDQLLATLGEDPPAFNRWVADPGVKRRSASLLDRWRAVDSLLLSLAPQLGLPWSVLSTGDLSYPALADRGAHGLWARSAAELATALSTISDAHIEHYARTTWAHFAATTDRAPHLTTIQLAAERSELRAYLSKLLGVTLAASAAGEGLLIARWEDW